MSIKLKFLMSTVCLSSCIMALASCTSQTNGNNLGDDSSHDASIDPFVSVTCSETIGHGFDFDGEKKAEIGFDYRCQFVSRTYELVKGAPLFPIHNELKLTDLEVLRGDENITDLCILEHNVLIIPWRQLEIGKPITINILGAEIAPWITWEEITSISDQDIVDEEHELVKQYFQVGDYKKIYKDKKPYANARLIGFYQQDYTYKDKDGTTKYKPSPLTFEMQEQFTNETYNWGFTNIDTNYYVYQWETASCELFGKSNEILAENKFGVVPRPVDLNIESKENSYFFPLSLTDYVGMTVSRRTDDKDGSFSLPEFPNEGKFSYYKSTEYKTTKSFYDKIKERNLPRQFYTRDWSWHFITDPYGEGYSAHLEQNYWIYTNGTGGKFEAITKSGPSYPVCWAFCL